VTIPLGHVHGLTSSPTPTTDVVSDDEHVSERQARAHVHPSAPSVSASKSKLAPPSHSRTKTSITTTTRPNFRAKPDNAVRKLLTSLVYPMPHLLDDFVKAGIRKSSDLAILAGDDYTVSELVASLEEICGKGKLTWLERMIIAKAIKTQIRQ
jgi:hypothetical protein